MKILKYISIFLLCMPMVSFAGKPLEITWEDLVPKIGKTTDILGKMGEEERGYVEWIVYLRQFLPEEIGPENEEFHEEVQKALPKLLSKGIDVDAIIAERKLINSSLNNKLDGQEIRLKGYLLPLDINGKTVTEFLLVPFIGACIHVPPPPLNQIVYAKLGQPLEFQLENLFLPVAVTGKLTTKNQSRELFLVDGSDDINIGYSMAVETIDVSPAKDD